MLEFIEKKYIAVLLIVGISLAAFYPSLNSNVIDLDDTSMILDINNPDKKHSINNLFWPNDAERYFRPLLMLSFIVDSKIWMYEFSGYHLTNIVLHLFNALILYFIAVTFFNGKPQFRVFAFLLTIGFVLHPLTIESVAWISGRTDILSTFFALSAFLFYLSKFKFKSIFVSIFFLFGLLAKENAFCLLLIIPLCEIAFNYQTQGLKDSIVSAFSWIGILMVPLFVYCFLRFAGFGIFQGHSHITPVLIQGMHIQEGVSFWTQMFSSIPVLPAVIAFYFKKLVFPFPLNFAISEISLFVYSIVFVIISIISVVFVLKRKLFYPFWLLLLCISFSPALPVALADVAWTRFAERYLYLSVPVICLFAGDLYYRNLLRYPERTRTIKVIAFAILIVFSLGSIQRINVWKDKESLWEDTYKKNPTHGKVLYKYGSVLGKEKGLPYFKLAVEHAKDNEWKDFSLLIVAQNEADNLNYNKAYDLIREALKINPERQNCYQAAGILKQRMKDKALEDDKYIRLLLYCYQLAYEKKPRPEDLLNLIQIFESLNDQDNIKKYSMLLIKKFPGSRAAKFISSKHSN